MPLLVPSASFPFNTLTGLKEERKNEGYSPARKPTVLVVEDNAMVALMLEDMLAEGGYPSVRSSDGRRGPAAPEHAADAGAAVVNLRSLDGQDGLRARAERTVVEERDRRVQGPAEVGAHPPRGRSRRRRGRRPAAGRRLVRPR